MATAKAKTTAKTTKAAPKDKAKAKAAPKTKAAPKKAAPKKVASKAAPKKAAPKKAAAKAPAVKLPKTASEIAAEKKQAVPMELREAPVLDLSSTSGKKFLRDAKAKGYVTHDQLNAVLPSDKVSSDQIEDAMAALSELGINVVESDEEGEAESVALIKAEDKKVIAQKGNARGSDRTDDPVRMYLREMGTVELLSREGEIAIAKRIEAGRDAMIRGLCESPLSFEAMMVWRDELMNERILLRDVIDLEATYGAENPPPVVEPKDENEEEGEEADGAEASTDDDDEDEDEGAAMSMSAMEASLRDGVLETLDAISSDFARYRKLQEKLVARRMEGKELTPKTQKEYDDLGTNIVENLKTMHINNARIEA